MGSAYVPDAEWVGLDGREARSRCGARALRLEEKKMPRKKQEHGMDEIIYVRSTPELRERIAAYVKARQVEEPGLSLSAAVRRLLSAGLTRAEREGR
jgi:hypothetical protein